MPNWPVKVNLNEQDNGSWEVKACVLEHKGHVITSKGLFSHQQSRKLDEEDNDFVKELLKVTANPRNISMPSQRGLVRTLLLRM